MSLCWFPHDKIGVVGRGMTFQSLHVTGNGLFHFCCCAIKCDKKKLWGLWILAHNSNNSPFWESQGGNLQELVTSPAESGESVHGCLLLKFVACHCSSRASHERVLPTFGASLPTSLNLVKKDLPQIDVLTDQDSLPW